MNKDYILHKWLNNTASKKEIEELKASPEYAEYLKIAEVSSKLDAPSIDSGENYKIIEPRLSTKGKVRELNPLKTILKIAAVFAVVITGYLYVDSLETNVKTTIAEKHSFLLPDNSEVVLNANSTIEYDKNNWNKERELTLEGEAYFKVTKGSSFSVITPNGVVTVLGTEFNVFARDDMFLVNCYEGLVDVTFNDTSIKLPAGTKITLENGVVINHNEISKISPNWIADESSFENTTLQNVLNELEIQYPITITADISNLNRRFTGSFTHKNLNLALKSICDPLQLTYTIREESISIYAKEGQ